MLCCFTKRRFIFPNLEKLRPLGQPDLSFMNCLHHSSFPQDWKVEKEKNSQISNFVRPRLLFQKLKNSHQIAKPETEDIEFLAHVLQLKRRHYFQLD